MPELKTPTKQTLNRYGLTLEAWQLIAARQGYVCAVCKTLPSSGRLHVEHEHVKGWKKQPPEERVKAVRGLCCFMCNTQYLGRGITVAKAKAVVAYLEAYAAR